MKAKPIVNFGYGPIEEDDGEFEMGEDPVEPPPKISLFDRLMTYFIEHWTVTLAFSLGAFLGTIFGLTLKGISL